MPKRIAPLSDMQVNKAKAREKSYTMFDGGGLYLKVTPTGGKLWRLKYIVEGKNKLISLGTYPEISLARAREKRLEARKQLAEGIDPHLADMAARTAAGENSFEAIGREWHARFMASKSEDYRSKMLAAFERDLFPWIGALEISTVKPADLLACLRRIEGRGTLETAHRTRSACGRVFRYAIATGRAERDIAADLQGALPPYENKHYAAVTDPKELAGLLRAIDGYSGGVVTRAALRLVPLLFVRPGELRMMEWAEVDLEAAEWNIPAGKMKMKKTHLVPLCRQAVEIIREMQPLSGRFRYVFPCTRTAKRCMSENTVNAAFRRMGFDKETVTGHGFRATARTIMDEVRQVRPDFIEHQLAHKVKDPNGWAYNRTAHLEERRKMMQQWADYLDGLKDKLSSTS